MEVGDSLSRSIDKGLANSDYGIVVISPWFIKKKWPERELRGLVAREVSEEQKVILPIWLGVTKQEVLTFSPPLADTIAIRSEGMDADEIALSLVKTVRPDIYKQHPRAELEKMLTGAALQDLQEELEYVKYELSEFQCPHCNAPLTERTSIPDDPAYYIGEVGEDFACGYSTIDERMISPCPSSDDFPPLDEFEFVTRNRPDDRSIYTVFLEPKTKRAQRLQFHSGETARTEEQAKQQLVERYNRRAKPWSGC